jgi:hypothetical protein
MQMNSKSSSDPVFLKPQSFQSAVQKLRIKARPFFKRTKILLRTRNGLAFIASEKTSRNISPDITKADCSDSCSYSFDDETSKVLNSRVARFFLVQCFKTGNMYMYIPNDHNVPIAIHKIHQIYKYQNFPFQYLKNIPKLGFSVCKKGPATPLNA